jgi:hypothetical protein
VLVSSSWLDVRQKYFRWRQKESINCHLIVKRMNFKYNAALLKKVEDILKEGGYTVRYEKGTSRTDSAFSRKEEWWL